MVTALNQFLIYSLGILCLIPSIILFFQCKATQISDFLVFSSVFFSVSIASFSQILSVQTNLLIFFQFHRWALIWTFFSFFLHGCRLRWNRTPKIIWYVGVCSFSILSFLVLFFEIMPQPEHAFVLFFEIDAVPGFAHPNGAGLITKGGVVIFSSSHYFISTLYQIFGSIILLYAYLKLDPPFPTKRVLLTKKLFILAWTIVLIFGICNLPWVFHSSSLFSTQLLNLLIVISALIIALVAILIPESMLISQAQIIRAHKLFEIVQKDSFNQIEKYKRIFLDDYIRSIPEEILEKKTK